MNVLYTQTSMPTYNSQYAHASQYVTLCIEARFHCGIGDDTKSVLHL